MKIKKIEERYFNGSQSLEFRGIYVLETDLRKFKIKISIDRDSYDKQSSANVMVFSDNLQWNLVASIPYSQMKVVVEDVFCQRKAENMLHREKVAFLSDIRELKELAKKILA